MVAADEYSVVFGAEESHPGLHSSTGEFLCRAFLQIVSSGFSIPLCLVDVPSQLLYPHEQALKKQCHATAVGTHDLDHP